jgi:hypothetical protein
MDLLFLYAKKEVVTQKKGARIAVSFLLCNSTVVNKLNFQSGGGGAESSTPILISNSNHLTRLPLKTILDIILNCTVLSLVLNLHYVSVSCPIP